MSWPKNLATCDKQEGGQANKYWQQGPQRELLGPAKPHRELKAYVGKLFGGTAQTAKTALYHQCSKRNPDGMKSGEATRTCGFPDYAALHPGYINAFTVLSVTR